MTRYGVITDYDYNADHKRHKIDVWSGPWSDVYEATGLSLPKGDGYMLTTYNGDKVRVTCPVIRTEDNYQEQDDAINAAMNEYEAKRGTHTN